MRLLFSVLTLVFIQLISLQFASGQEPSAKNRTQVKEKSATKAYRYKFSKKSGSSFKKILFEDIPFIHSTFKKSGFDYPLSFDIPEYFKQSQLLKVKIYNAFLSCCYSFIFDYLYPKHVFW
ncbi:hypothetical protein SAMN04488101_10538 [Pedobacter nyackensis]|uniref:Uncharacterized protein n=1 Tax=Pedobacter nyackensis TaxID=475255 RepID=A0A1W2CXJ8_9SPHI|nr:hypothetical protein SAMN04488101_10538 [Pedobacter nyackensis]